MARPTSDILTERESQIMDILWELKAATADDVRERLPDDLHDSTVRTLLRILTTKNYVSRDTRGRRAVYRPVVTRARVQRKVAKSLLKRFFSGSAEDLVLRLLEDDQLTAKQLDKLKRAHSSRRKPGAKR